ncbi:siderophore ABC transporter substrate-binding protein [Streptococcus sp. H31]|uniref:siderophore ABC transporter substrate-binding protein n=1 Tax=Streptococcus huangxiaojuni TaxID=3237239 RepID=UPI0034A32698
MKLTKPLLLTGLVLAVTFLALSTVSAADKTVKIKNDYTISSNSGGNRGNRSQNSDSNGNNSSEQGEESSEEKKVSETVEVPVNPKKVLVFDMGALDTITALGKEDSVAGLPKSQNATDKLSDDMQEIYNDDKYQDVGTLFEPNFETIASIQPDVIFLGARMANSDNIEKLKEAAPDAVLVYASTDSEKDFSESVEERVTMFGKIYNQAKKAKNYNKKITKAMKKLKKSVKDKDASSALFVMANSGELLSQSPSGRFGWLFSEAGFTAVNSEEEASTHGSQISYEYLSEKNPYYLFVLDRGDAIGQGASADELLANDVLQDADAIKNNRVLQVNAQDWYINSGGVRVTLRMIKEVQDFIDNH